MQYVEIEKKYVFHTDQLAFHSIQSKLMRLLEEMRSNKFGRDAQISVCINDLVLNINRLAYEQNTPKQKYHDYHLYDQLTAYIEEHMDEDLSLDTLAKHFFVSKYHIAHIFKDNIGISIHQYITKKRLSLCKDAISGKMNITDAYQKFGFGDYSSFYRAFKKEFGISPKDFRDMQINLE
jgi:AraC-like DNA-binding protein